MSQINLLSQSFFRVPSIPNIAHTLQLIQTQKNFPFNSTVSLDQHISEQLIQEDQQLSIDHNLDRPKNEVVTSTSITKKKKNGCTCKKTKCLKMYCQCFREGKMCTEQCSCYGCSNDEFHQHQVSKAREHVSHKLQSAKHVGKGCNCKKSQCQKKYCQCFNSGVPCGQACKCEDCANGACEDHRTSSPKVSVSQLIDDIDSLMSVLN